MIPIKLSFQGLYSYQKKQEIDFTCLTDNNIFGIFGSVGSGKSSILEAITFALYGKTERFNLSGDNRNYNMMNLKSDRLRIEFDFITGSDNMQYKVKCEAKRNSKKFEDVKTIDRTAYIKHNDTFVPISTEELENAIGLSYVNFKRTVIIPQGKFQEFLQLKSTDRTRMMKELFNLDKYELFNPTKQLLNESLAKLQHLNGKIEQIGTVSKEDIDGLKIKIKEVKTKLLNINKEIDVTDKVIKEQERLKELDHKLGQLEESKKLYELKKSEIIEKEKLLNQFEYCSIHFKSLIDHIEKDLKNKELLLKEYNEDSKKQSTLKSKKEEVAIEFNKINTRFENIENEVNKKESIEKLIEINENKQKIENNNKRLLKGKEVLKENLDIINKLEKSELEAQENINNLKKRLPNIELISKAQEWHQKQITLEQKNNELNNELTKSNESVKSSKESLINNYSESGLFSILKKDENIWISDINKSKTNLTEELSVVTKDIQELVVQSKLEQFASNLKEGDSCPLCGSVEHPNIISSSQNSIKLNELNHKKDSIEKKIRLIDDLFLHVQQYFNSKEIHLKQIVELEKKLKLNGEHIENHSKIFNDSYPTSDSAKVALEKFKEINISIEKEDRNKLFIRKKLEKELKNKERYSEELSKLEKETDGFTTAISILNNQINSAAINLYKNFNNEQLLETKKTLEFEISDIKKKHSEIKVYNEKISKEIDLLEGSISTKKNFLSDLDKNINSNKKLLNDKLKDSTFDNSEDIKRVLGYDIDIVKLRNEINNFHKELHNTNEKINELKLAYDNNSYKKDLLTEKINLFKTLVESQEKAIRDETLFNSMLNDLNEKLKQLKDFTAQKKELELRKEEINTLLKLFKGSGFVNYISSVYLQNLCYNANKRFFKMTGQKLSLELNSDNSFEVRDYLNSGKTRSIKTLSGGQTFQASLALALALSDNIQSMTKTKQNFFFLDEGFGSLDKESLHIIFNTLKNLKKENRIVGIISHVEELQQEIPTFLQVNQKEETGSFIKESWNL